MGLLGFNGVVWVQFGLLMLNVVCRGFLGLNGVLWVQCILLRFNVVHRDSLRFKRYKNDIFSTI